MKHWPTIAQGKTGHVFVPLCGKSLDMAWLAERGHHVLGVELSNVAVKAFFEEQRLDADVAHNGRFDVFRAGNLELWCGDFFAMTAEDVRGCDTVFDRASLIALPRDLREQYAAHMGRILSPRSRTLLLTIAYDQSEMDGPPFSVSDGEVEALYSPWADVVRRESRDALSGSRNLQERGVTAVTTSVFEIEKRADP